MVGFELLMNLITHARITTNYVYVTPSLANATQSYTLCAENGVGDGGGGGGGEDFVLDPPL